MDRRGVVVFEIGLWIMRIILVILILAGVALQVRTYVNAKVNLDVAEPALLVHILGSSPVFLYRDAGWTSHRVVDAEKFRTAFPESLAGALGFKQRHAAARVTLTDASGKKSVLFLNQDYYDELAAQGSRFMGKNVVATEREWPVLIMDEGQESTGVLAVQVIQPA